jgi:diguanylate cyclase (GGDEF)-like protein
MNRRLYSAGRLPFLEERIRYLENANSAYVAILDTLASSSDFQANINRGTTVEAILQATLTQLKRFLPFPAMGLLVNGEDGSFELIASDPEERRDELLADVDAMIMDGTFAWALNRNQAITVPSMRERTLLLHVIATQNQIRGMFIGQIPGDRTTVDLPSLNALTTVLLTTAYAIESRTLHTMLQEHMRGLDQKVRERTAELLAARVVAETTSLELKQSNERLRKLSDTDSLTGLYNRRFLMENLERELLLAQRKMTGLSLVIMDIDHFKSINDTYGHLNGDLVLVGVAEVIQSELRSNDIVARYGGEEFVLALPGTPYDMAVTVAERLREAVQAMSFTPPMDDLSVTVSLGVASFPFHRVDGIDDLLRDADDALYLAKQKGRNRVESLPLRRVKRGDEGIPGAATVDPLQGCAP